ncbi:hypothetical protein ACS0TY_016618 [Phlomoides rotata]
MENSFRFPELLWQATGTDFPIGTAAVLRRSIPDETERDEIVARSHDFSERLPRIKLEDWTKEESPSLSVCTEYTIEEKVIKRVYKKLALDALVIKQGRLAEAKSQSSLSTTLIPSAEFHNNAILSSFFFLFFWYAYVNKDVLLQMVRFGAEMVFGSKDNTIIDEDIYRIISKGEEATTELDMS